MYLNLGQEVLYKQDIVGIFDLDTATVAEKTRRFLSRAERENKTVTLSLEDLPRSFIVTQRDTQTQQTIYISQLTTATLQKRAEEYY